MAEVPVTVERTNGESKIFALDLDATLQKVRATLTGKGFMFINDHFLMRNAEVDTESEQLLKLNQLVGNDNSQPLQVGTLLIGLESPDESLQRYNSLNVIQKLALFENLEIYRGLTASLEEGFHRTFESCIASWNQMQLPNSRRHNFVTEVAVEFSFTEVTNSLIVSSVNKGSVSLNTPFGGGKAEFEHARQTSTGSKEVTQYLAGKFSVNKVVLDVDIKNLQLVPDFKRQISDAVKSTDYEIDQYVNLINTLNRRGYFVPKTFRLGGALLSTSSTKVSEFSQAESERKEFAVGFRLTIKGFGGGGDYSTSPGREESSSTTSEYSDLTIQKIGGTADASEYNHWAKSLNPAINWDVISYNELYPTMALLEDKNLLRQCLRLMNTYSSYETVKDKQKVISIEKYATQVENILMGGGSGIG